MGSCLGHETNTNDGSPNSNNNNQNSSKIKGSNPHQNHHSLASSCLRRQPTPTDDQEQNLISNLNGHLKQDSFIVRIVNFKRKKKTKRIFKKFWLNKNSKYAKLNNELKSESNNDVQLQNLDVTSLYHNSGHIQDETSINFIIHNGDIPLSRGGSSIDLEWEHEYTQLTQFEPFYHHYNYNQHRKLNIEKLSTNNLINQPNIIEVNHEKEFEPSINSIDSLTLSDKDDNRILRDEFPNGTSQQNHLNNVNRDSQLRRNLSQQSWSHLSTPESLEWDIDDEQQQQLTLIEDDNLDDDTLNLLHEIEELKNRVLCETGDNLFNDNYLNSSTENSNQFLEELNDNNEYSSKKFDVNFNNNNNYKSPCFQWLISDNENGNYS